MSDVSKIEWTDATWNPISGCTKVSPGCDNCYAETMHERFNGKGSFTTVTLHPDRLDKPLHWRKPRRVFVNSMSDLFHDDVPDEYIARVWSTMRMSPQHTFQVLTKRHGRMRAWLNRCATWDGYITHNGNPPSSFGGDGVIVGWPEQWPLPNVWLGVSVEDQKWADIRIPALLQTPAAVRWISAEPLLGHVDLVSWLTLPPSHPGYDHDDGTLGLDWVVVGGESGPGARPMHPEWARELRDQCELAEVPFFFKQWGQFQPQNVERYSELLKFSDPSRGCVVELDGRTSVAWTMSGRDLRDDGAAAEGAAMLNVGKGRAGRVLDGRVHDGFPVVSP